MLCAVCCKLIAAGGHLASAKSAFIEKRADVWSSEVSVSIIDYRDANLLALRLFEPS
jgi:hypothetical protein